MQEFRRPEWCAYQLTTEKVLTGLSEENLLLLATTLAGDEVEHFYILQKSSDRWKKYLGEKNLHRPLDFNRGVSPPELTKVKRASPATAPPPQPVPPQQQAPPPPPPVYPMPPAQMYQAPPQKAQNLAPIEKPAPGDSWSLCFVPLGKVVTELTIQEILLMATIFHPAELQYVWVLNRNFSQWRNIQTEASLRIPLEFQRNVQTVSLQKVKPLESPKSQAPVQTPVPARPQAPAPSIPTESPRAQKFVRGKDEDKPQTIVRKPRIKMTAEIFGPMPWRGEVTGVHWPLLIFDREMQFSFEFFQLQVTLGSKMYLLSAFRGDEIRDKLPNAAMVLMTQEAVQFEEALEGLKIK